MQYTQADIDQLRADIRELNTAIGSGVRSVTLRGVTTLYNTSESLTKARDDLKGELAAAEAQVGGKARSSMTRLWYSGRGF